MNEDGNHIEVQIPKYFVGKASIKYRGEHAPSLLLASPVESIYHMAQFYDIRIQDLRQLTPSEYRVNLKRACFEITNYDGPVVIAHEGREFDLNPSELLLIESPQLAHNQVEGNEIFGHFSDTEVIFLAHRAEQRSVEEVESEAADEVIEEEYVAPPPKCTQDALTGKREDEEYRYRVEHYNADCSTYWGKWIKKKKKPLIRKPSVPDNSSGCLGSLAAIAIGGLILAKIVAFIWTGAWMVLMIYGGVAVGIILVVWLIQLLSRISWLGRAVGFGLTWLFNGFVAFAIIYGITSFFTRNNWSGENRVEFIDADSSIEINEVPVSENDSELIDADNDPSTDPIADTKIKVSIKWKSLNGKPYSGTYGLLKSDWTKSAKHIESISNNLYRSYGPIYQNLSNYDQDRLSGLYTMLDSIQDATGESGFEFANTIVSMVQSIEYVLVVEGSCEEARRVWGQTMNLNGVKCAGYSTFGLKTPLEFLCTLAGDCDTRTLLLYTILKHYNYDVAIINSDFYRHSMLGLNLPEGQGVYKLHGGTKYYFWETTAKGFRLGDLPRENGVIKFWEIVIN